MDARELKNQIYTQGRTLDVLQALGCHHIKNHGNYISCGVPDGDNPSSTIIYIDSPNLNVKAYTRNIVDTNNTSDILTLVSFIRQEPYFAKNIKWICETIGISYYYKTNISIPSLAFTAQYLEEKKALNQGVEKDIPVKPISESVLKSYLNVSNIIFSKDGLSCRTQSEFEIGYDPQSERITIPIRDEIGTLVGVKGRTIHTNSQEENKYIYLEACNKSKILYGLYKTYSHIQKHKQIIVVESEKSVMKLWQNGIYNSVAIGGHDLSKHQIRLITQLGVNEVVLCYDEDVFRQNGKIIQSLYIEEANKFLNCQKVTAIIDIGGKVLNPKESPADNIDVFQRLFDKRVVLKNNINKEEI